MQYITNNKLHFKTTIPRIVSSFLRRQEMLFSSCVVHEIHFIFCNTWRVWWLWLVYFNFLYACWCDQDFIDFLAFCVGWRRSGDKFGFCVQGPFVVFSRDGLVNFSDNLNFVVAVHNWLLRSWSVINLIYDHQALEINCTLVPVCSYLIGWRRHSKVI